MTETLTAELTPYNPDVVWLKFRGRIEMDTAPAFRRQLVRSLPTAERALILDLSGVSYMDSSGVAVLVEALQWSRGQEADLILYTPSRAVCEAVEVVGLGRVFKAIGRYGEIEETYGPATGDEATRSSRSSRRLRARRPSSRRTPAVSKPSK